MRRGDRGAQVAAAQRALMALGARVVGGADGIFGIYTERAVAAFQSRRGLPISGQVDAATARGARRSLAGQCRAAAAVDDVGERRPGRPRGDDGRADPAGRDERRDLPARRRRRRVRRRTRAPRVVTYQQQRGLPASGVVDEATAIAMGLFVAAARSALGRDRPTWARSAQGARGPWWRSMQRAVMNAGIFLRGGADGVFGELHARPRS